MIELRQLTVAAGSFRLTGVSLAVPDQKYAVLMGRTGCGKTTLLETICGLRPVVSGTVLLDGRDVTRLATAARGIGYVPQDAALFSTMTVRGHLAYALAVRRWDPSRIDERVAELARLLGITPLLDRYPRNLSGGEARRVALGRALAFYPTTLLLDEPLSGLDDDTRREMYRLLKDVQQTTGVTTLHVTHSQEDVGQLAECRFVLEDGQIEAQDHKKLGN